MCGLQNMRTLCVLCHDLVSAKQAARAAKRDAGAALLEPNPAAGSKASAKKEKDVVHFQKHGDDIFEGDIERLAKEKERKSKADKKRARTDK